MSPAQNTEAVVRSGKKLGICVIPGMEICSKEEVHLLGLFESLENTLAMQEYVYAHLKGENQPKVFGHQVIVNEHDEVLGEDSHLLIGATELNIRDITVKIHDLGGVCIASHIDRPAFGVINQLGFIPPDLLLDGVEVSYRVPLGEARQIIPAIMNLPCISSSDAHFPDDIGKANTVFVLSAPTLAEIRLALKSQNGRRIKT
jgi:PHP family Zn ribbon phosphoesterase